MSLSSVEPKSLSGFVPQIGRVKSESWIIFGIHVCVQAHFKSLLFGKEIILKILLTLDKSANDKAVKYRSDGLLD